MLEILQLTLELAQFLQDKSEKAKTNPLLAIQAATMLAAVMGRVAGTMVGAKDRDVMQLVQEQLDSAFAFLSTRGAEDALTTIAEAKGVIARVH